MIALGPRRLHAVIAAGILWSLLAGPALGADDKVILETKALHRIRYCKEAETIVAFGAATDIFVFDVKGGATSRVLAGHTEAPNAISFLDAGNFLISASNDKTLRVWDLKKGVEVNAVKWPRPIYGLATYGPDGDALLGGASGEMLTLQKPLNARSTPRRLPVSHDRPVTLVAVSHDAEFAISGADDGSVIVWEMKTRTGRKFPKIHAELVGAIAVSPVDACAATGAEDGTLALWRLGESGMKSTLCQNGAAITQVLFSPDGQHVFSSDVDGTIRRWSVRTGAIAGQMKHSDYIVWDISISPDGRALASAGSDGKIRIWDAESGNLLDLLIGHHRDVYSTQFTHGGRQLWTAGEDGTLRRWTGLATPSPR